MPPKTPNSKSRTSPVTGPPKMRSSCEACANSKIGCSKERPTCSQCERRGIACVYIATKRAGRPAKNKQREQSIATQTTTEDNSETSMPSIASPTAPSLCAGWPNNLTDATIMDTTMGNTMTADTSGILTPPSSMSHQHLDWSLPPYSGMFKGLPTLTTDEEDLESTLPQVNKPFSQLLNTTSPMSLLDDNRSINWDLFIPPSLTCHESTENMWSNCLADSSRACDTNTLPETRRTGETPPESIDWFSATDVLDTAEHGSISDTPKKQDYHLPTSFLSHGKSSSNGCLARCLCLLNQMTPQWNGASCTQNKEKNSASNSVSFETVMAQNQAAIDAVNEMLDCPCSRNSVLLFTIFLVICNMLGWYAACADAPSVKDMDAPGSLSFPSSMGRTPPIVRRPLQSTLRDYETDVNYEDRIVCQIVLSRLYSVRRILGALTQRMTETEERPSTSSSSPERISAATVDLLLAGPAFDSSNLGQTLAQNASRHLHELCENIIKNLAAL